MSDLASQPLEDTPENPLTLAERRANYESWLASGRKAPKPIPQLHTGLAHTRIDDVDAGRKLQPPEVGTLNPLPPGAVIRTDEGGDDANPSDDVRLGLGKMLLKKAEGASPEEATRIANAANAILGPMVRTDDDADLKKTVTGQGPVKKGSSPGAATAKDEDEEEPDKDKAKPRKVPDDDEGNEPTLRELMDALTGLGKRMDAFEKKPDDDDEDIPEKGAPLGKGEGTPKALAADSDLANHKRATRWRKKMDEIGEVLCRPDTQDLFTEFQAKADPVFQLFGMQAEKPLHGEKLINYRRRLLQPMQKYSPAFKHADLRVVAVDPAGFKAAEDSILASARQEGTNPTQIPLGFLREVKETRGGHEYTKFYGRPITWMSPFMVQGKRVKRIVERQDGGPGRTLYERN